MYGKCALLLSTADYLSDIFINKNPNDQDLLFKTRLYGVQPLIMSG